MRGNGRGGLVGVMVILSFVLFGRFVLLTEGYRQLLQTNGTGRSYYSTNLTNANSNATVANVVPLEGRKIILKFCTRYFVCDHGNSCYCCQGQEDCYETWDECKDNCPACSPTCPLQSSPRTTVKDQAIDATSYVKSSRLLLREEE
ncbi:hypothetical protein C2845_PM07G19660 [Panicum miliaceum]|uniref:Uncharacterized protein n=1 Tax=Panicum miliaceum TaxID=4540 RepID=A0A3L6SNB7_PANMI|nr:hypothetical protein C2845_PM07G19660 [Panicum miliaceum]